MIVVPAAAHQSRTSTFQTNTEVAQNDDIDVQKLSARVRLRVHRKRWEHILYKKVLLAYDGSIDGRRALREGARIAQLCSS
jgi:hypothetical protein